MKPLAVAALSTFSLVALSAEAAPLTWQTADAVVVEQPVYINGGGTLTFHGGFTFDASTNTLSDWAFFAGVRGTGGAHLLFTETAEIGFNASGVVGFTFAPVQSVECLTVFTGCRWEQIIVGFLGMPAPTDAGGTLSVNIGYTDTGFTGSGDSTISASAAPAVPLPAGLPLLAGGLALTGLALRRRKT